MGDGELISADSSIRLARLTAAQAANPNAASPATDAIATLSTVLFTGAPAPAKAAASPHSTAPTVKPAIAGRAPNAGFSAAGHFAAALAAPRAAAASAHRTIPATASAAATMTTRISIDVPSCRGRDCRPNSTLQMISSTSRRLLGSRLEQHTCQPEPTGLIARDSRPHGKCRISDEKQRRPRPPAPLAPAARRRATADPRRQRDTAPRDEHLVFSGRMRDDR